MDSSTDANRPEGSHLPGFQPSPRTRRPTPTRKVVGGFTLEDLPQAPVRVKEPASEHPEEPAEPVLSPNCLKVLEKRYLAKDETGKVIETPKEMFWRVAKNVASADILYDRMADLTKTEVEFYNLMVRNQFLPNSPTLMNAGRELQQLSACFVLPVADSMDGIFDTVKHAAIIHKTGGGTGFSFSRLRPKDDVVRTTGGVASGPVSFMKVFNHATEAVKQGGTRRGANMGILRVDHPDIEEFITCKADKKEVVNFNISVAITDTFMEAVAKGEMFDLVNPRSKKAVRQIDARALMDKIAYNAWQTGEPGLFFIDVTNRTNPTPHVADFEATNPCGEQPLLPYESCNLGSLNLETHVREVGGRMEVDWERLERSIRTAVHFLDNIIDMNKYPIPQIEEITKANRKIGLGVMGFARMLFKLGVPYDSEEGLDMAEQVMEFVQRVGYDASARLADTRGPYANWKGSLHEKRGERIRNSYVTTVAPTGTLSMIADTSGGCEPEFSLIWYKNVMGGEHLPYTLDYFMETAEREGFWSEDLTKKVLANQGSARGIPQIPETWQRVFVTSHNISPEWHVRMQAAFQKYSDSAVSKTINLPEKATVEDVKEAYLLAYELGCKGITVYRDGSRPDQVMNVGTSSKGDGKSGQGGMKPGESVTVAILPISPKPRPKITTGVTSQTATSCGNLYVTINEDESGKAFETFSAMGKAGGCEASMNEAIARLISLTLRCGANPDAIVKQLIGIRCDKPFGFGKDRVLSCSDAIAKSMREYILSKAGRQPAAAVGQDLPGNKKAAFPCPDCGCELEFAEGCEKCQFCGYSRCF